jgi:PAS domain S-box-containing protein
VARDTSDSTPSRPTPAWEPSLVAGGSRPLAGSPDAQAWLAAIVESSDDAIVGKNLESTILSWNTAATRLFGYEAGEIIGQSVLRLIPPELHHEEPLIVGRIARGERVEHYETTRVRKDGSRVAVSLSVSPIRNASGVVIGAAKIARDITERRRLEQAERQLTEQLQEQALELEQQAMELEHQVEEAQSLAEEVEASNKQLEETTRQAQQARIQAETANRTKSDFLAVMSHELRTPLNAITGYVELIELGLRGPVTADQGRDLARIRRSARTLLQLIEDVLSFAKLESGRVEYRITDVPVGEMLDDVTLLIAPQAQVKELEFSIVCTDRMVSVRADRDKVERIVLNLLANAVKFTQRGRVELRCEVDDSQVRIIVGDTGRGIPADQLERIFEPFVQVERGLNRTTDGTGLGLSIARDLADGMGGTLVAESTPGVGSSFTLSLPRA